LLDQLVDLGPSDSAQLSAEPLTALALERILTLLVDLAFASNSHVAVGLLGRAPDTYAESFILAAEAGMIDTELATAPRPSVGMRNVLVHNYLAVDHNRVAVAVPIAVEQYGAYVRHVAAFLQTRAGLRSARSRVRTKLDKVCLVGESWRPGDRVQHHHLRQWRETGPDQPGDPAPAPLTASGHATQGLRSSNATGVTPVSDLWRLGDPPGGDLQRVRALTDARTPTN
jgi:uncharacterized protein YutE (UPF0331/DUF86 family)